MQATMLADLEFREAMRARDIEPDGPIVADGQLHRFRVEGDRRGNRNGWYVFFGDDPPAGAFGCWKRGIHEKWSARPEDQLTERQRAEWMRRMEEVRRRRESEKGRRAQEAHERATRIWNRTLPANPHHPYLHRKRVGPHGIRQHEKGGITCLVIPVVAGESDLCGLQFITADGKKRFMRGTVKRAGYHLIGAAADETPSTVIIAEGYATAATLCEASGYAVAVAFDCGNLAPVAQAMSARFPQARLIVAADNDRSTENNPGVRYAQEAARTVGASVAVPSFAQGEDGTDWNDFAALYGLARVAAEVDSAAVSGPLPSEGLKEQAWPLPAPLPAGLPIVNEFSDLILPESLRPWLVDIADRMQCPPDIPAAAAMVALACVVGRKIGIRPKRRDDWTVVPNLWGAVVGRPGILKTPAVEAVLQPLKRLEMAAAESHEAALRQWEADKIVRGEQMKIAKGSIRKQLNAHADAAALARELAAREEPEAPARRRYLVNDSTIEKLGELLSANPNGVLVYRDELIGWLRNLDREGHESARAFYLEAWNGTGRFTYDRIGRGTLDIEAAIVSVFGCIQPGPLRDYLRGAAEGGGADDGLVQRFQVMVWPDTSSEWRNVDRWPDSAAAAKASIVFHKLDNLTADGAGAQRDRLEDAIPFLRFDDAAQEAFDAWRTDLEQRLRSAVEHPALESHLAKYRSLIPTLSLLLHLADGHAGRVGELSLRAAVAWAEYLESHARRIYASVTGDTVPTKALADHLLAGDLPAGFALRDVYRREWSGLRTKEEAQAAIERLEDLRWIRAEEVPPGPSGGRGKTIFRVNPRLAEVVR